MGGERVEGYSPDDDLPSYRLTNAPLLLDGAMVGGRVSGQQVPLAMIPDVARSTVLGDIYLRQSIAEFAELVTSGRRKGEDHVRLAPSGFGELVALMNHELAKNDPLGGPFGPTRVVERVYWMVSLTVFMSILDVVRTTLVELVSEMRAGMPNDMGIPSPEVAERAVAVAIEGSGNRVLIQERGCKRYRSIGSCRLSLGRRQWSGEQVTEGYVVDHWHRDRGCSRRNDCRASSELSEVQDALE